MSRLRLTLCIVCALLSSWTVPIPPDFDLELSCSPFRIYITLVLEGDVVLLDCKSAIAPTVIAVCNTAATIQTTTWSRCSWSSFLDNLPLEKTDRQICVMLIILRSQLQQNSWEKALYKMLTDRVCYGRIYSNRSIPRGHVPFNTVRQILNLCDRTFTALSVKPA